MAREATNCVWLTRKRGRRKTICCILLIVFITAIVRKIYNFHSKTNRFQDFMRDWCRVRQLRVDWEQVLKPCKDRLKWGSTSWDQNLQTDPDTSYISLWDIRPAGEFGRFSIQSTTTKGSLKKIGGDSWRVNINGPSSVAGTLFDHMNGTYEVLFLVTIPGLYNVEVTLEHSLCDGYTDPPSNWFKTGSAQGKNQKEGTLGDVKQRPFLVKKLWKGNPIVITIPKPHGGISMLQEIMRLYADQKFDISCGLKCQTLWDGFGNWVANGNTLAWKPFVPNDGIQLFLSVLDTQTYTFQNLFPDKPRQSDVLGERARSKSILWIYGDSVSEQFYNGIRLHPLCTRVFKWCGHTYNWVYNLKGNLSRAKNQDDELDFDDVRVVSELDDVIRHPIFDKNSGILLNAGLHYLESSNFSNYRKVVDGIVRLFDRRKVERPLWHDMKVFPGQVVWRTTTSLHKEKLDSRHLQSRRFLTSQRVLLFNAYSTQAMCRAGYHVVDAFPLTDAYPHGTGKPENQKDAVHYQHFVFEAVERLLEDFFIKTTKKD